jgi:hypothetical protein
MKTLLFLVASVGIATSNVVWSQDAKPAVDMSALQRACGDDVRKLCPNVKPGGGRIKDCMVAHKDELSPTCHDALLKAKENAPPR